MKKHLKLLILCICLLFFVPGIISARSYLNNLELVVTTDNFVYTLQKIGIGTSTPNEGMEVNYNMEQKGFVSFASPIIKNVNVNTIDWTKGNIQELEVGEGEVFNLNFTAPPKPSRLLLFVDAKDGCILKFPGIIKFKKNFDGTTVTADIINLPPRKNIYSFLYDGSSYYGVLLEDFR